jgi:transcription initiation factor TFIID subunit 5
MESANQEIDGRPLPQLGEDSRPKTRQGFGMSMITLSPSKILTNALLDLLKNWVEENLDLYKVGQT